MLSFLLRTVINAVALLVIANVFRPYIEVSNIGAAFIAALVLGVANATVKPILLIAANTATCALSCLTLGLWSLLLSWLVNALLFYLAGLLLPGFSVQGFMPTMLGALALSVVNAVAGSLMPDKRDDK